MDKNEKSTLENEILCYKKKHAKVINFALE